VFWARYAADGERVQKKDSESGPTHTYDYGLHDSNGDVFFTPGFWHQAADGTPARKYHHDAQGSTRYLTNKAGDTVSSSFRYDAFGQRTFLGGNNSDNYPTEYQYAGAYGYQTEPTTGDGLDLQYLYQRYYDPQAGRFITRDPIRWAGGTNLYGYAGNDPINGLDPLGLKGERIAYIFIGDARAMKPFQAPANDMGILADTIGLWRYFKEEGYTIRYKERVTPNDVTKALHNPAVKAVAFIGHDAFEGAVQLYPNPDGTDYYDPTDFAKALGGRKLDIAIFHVCFSDRPALRDATVGETGHFEGAKGFWTSFFRADLGSMYWWKGPRQRQFLRRR
jgi:RHS repeat-associated protein